MGAGGERGEMVQFRSASQTQEGGQPSQDGGKLISGHSQKALRHWLEILGHWQLCHFAAAILCCQSVKSQKLVLASLQWRRREEEGEGARRKDRPGQGPPVQ